MLGALRFLSFSMQPSALKQPSRVSLLEKSVPAACRLQKSAAVR